MYWKGFGKKETRDDEVKDGRSGKHKATYCCNQVSQLPNYLPYLHPSHLPIHVLGSFYSFALRDYSSQVNRRLPPRPRPTKRLANLYILLREKYDCSLGPFVDGGGEGRALAAAEISYERSVDPKDKEGEPPGLVKRQMRTVEKCLPYLMLWEYSSLAPDDPGGHAQSFRRSAT